MGARVTLPPLNASTSRRMLSRSATSALSLAYGSTPSTARVCRARSRLTHRDRPGAAEATAASTRASSSARCLPMRAAQHPQRLGADGRDRDPADRPLGARRFARARNVIGRSERRGTSIACVDNRRYSSRASPPPERWVAQWRSRGRRGRCARARSASRAQAARARRRDR